MRIKQLVLKNFRGFEDLTIDFPEGESGLAVFVGVNGSGKTSVLEGVANLLLNFLSDVLNEREDYAFMINVPLGRKDVYRNKSIDALCEIHCFCDINSRNILLANNTRFGDGNSFPSSFLETVYNTFLDLRIQFIKNQWRGIPVLCYYSAKRFIDDSPSLKAIDISGLQPIDAWKGAFNKTMNFNTFFEWFRNSEDIENQKRLRENHEFRLKGLELIRKVLPKFLEEFKNPYVNREGGEELVVEKDGLELSLSNLSQGERMILALAADIAMRLNIANPQLENPLEGDGVILIDEIEQHLHPGWQRTIIPNLRRTFPSIQFILTTHSPQVLSNVPRENVFILEDFKLEKNKPHTEGRDSNAILEDIFDVSSRPEEERDELVQLYDAIEKGEKEMAEKIFSDLKKKLGDRDIELLRAENYMDVL